MWRPESEAMIEDGDKYAIPPRVYQTVPDVGFTDGIKSLGREFNPLKFDFPTMRQFNPLKFEFDMVETETPDLMDILPESLGPERYVKTPQMGSTSHQDVTLSHRFHVNSRGDEPAPGIDSATLSLLDSLELKFAPSFSQDPMTQLVEDVLRPQPGPQKPVAVVPAVPMDEVKPEIVLENSPSPPEDHQGMTPEQLRVMRNKAVQKRYRQRKKTQASRQQNMFATTQAELRMAERRSSPHHLAVVDKLMRLRTLDKEQDAEIKRLRKILAEEKRSDRVEKSNVMVMDVDVEEGDFCDSEIQVVLPRNVALNAVVEASCAKMAEGLFKDNSLSAVVAHRFASSASPRLEAQ